MHAMDSEPCTMTLLSGSLPVGSMYDILTHSLHQRTGVMSEFKGQSKFLGSRRAWEQEYKNMHWVIIHIIYNNTVNTPLQNNHPHLMQYMPSLLSCLGSSVVERSV